MATGGDLNAGLTRREEVATTYGCSTRGICDIHLCLWNMSDSFREEISRTVKFASGLSLGLIYSIYKYVKINVSDHFFLIKFPT